jgi:hypothetical protein
VARHKHTNRIGRQESQVNLAQQGLFIGGRVIGG